MPALHVLWVPAASGGAALDMITFEHPLRWPVGWPRTHAVKRSRARYKVSFSKAVEDLLQTLHHMGVRDAQIATDRALQRNGRPYADGEPGDPGIAVYWTLLGQPRAIACDKWETSLGNVRAIGLALECLRGLERTGAGDIVERAYAGFAQLPSGDKPSRPWRVVLGLEGLAGPAFACRAAIDASYKTLAAKHHPDVGGSSDAFVEIGKARDDGHREFPQ